MADNPDLPAVYDPDRDPVTGHFRKGNSLSSTANTDVARRFKQLRAMWFDAQAPGDMADVRAELKNLCLTCPVPEVRLRAIIYYLDRTLGKPTERVELDVSQDAGPARLPELTPDEVVILQKVVRKTGGE